MVPHLRTVLQPRKEKIHYYFTVRRRSSIIVYLQIVVRSKFFRQKGFQRVGRG